MHKTRFVLSKPSSTEEATKSEARMLLCREEKMESGGNNTVSYRIVSLRRVFFWKFPTSTNLLMVPARDKEDEKKKKGARTSQNLFEINSGVASAPQMALLPTMAAPCWYRYSLPAVSLCAQNRSVRNRLLLLPEFC